MNKRKIFIAGAAIALAVVLSLFTRNTIETSRSEVKRLKRANKTLKTRIKSLSTLLKESNESQDIEIIEKTNKDGSKSKLTRIHKQKKSSQYKRKNITKSKRVINQIRSNLSCEDNMSFSKF